MEPTVTIYTSTLCPVCNLVKSFLHSLNISYQEVNVDLNPIAMLQLITKTKRLSVPQTMINGTSISGFQPEKIMQALYD